MTNIENIMIVLEILESPPSAYNLVCNHSSTPLTPQEEEESYERSDGENDELTRQALMALRSEQFDDLVATLAEIDQEHFDNDGEEGYEELVNGADIPALLDLPSR